MDGPGIESAVRRLYDARLKNEVEPCLESFGDDSTIRLAGSPESSEVASAAKGLTNIRQLLHILVAAWRWDKVEIDAMLIDGNQAATKYRLTATFLPTGRTVETEIMDHITFDDQMKVVELVQFIDTAMAQQLIDQLAAKGPAAGAS